MICINCGKKGHYSKNCKEPITSHGIIVVKQGGKRPKTKFSVESLLCSRHAMMKYNDQVKTINNILNNTIDDEDDVFFLLIQRRDTIGFIDFLRGKYTNNIRTLVGEMTCFERYKLKSMSFDQLWENTWWNKKSKLYKNERSSAKKKYDDSNIRSLLEEIPCGYDEPEIGFPKGRRNPGESDIDCALREFHEETGYSKSQITLTNHKWVEEFKGTDGVIYRLVYTLATIHDDAVENPDWNINIVKSLGEISRIKWMTKNECLKQLRPYDSEKKKMIEDVHAFVVTNCGLFGG